MRTQGMIAALLAMWQVLGWAAFEDEVIEIGSRRELFLDNFLIERMENARLELEHPVPGPVAITFDQPWEGRYSGYVTVFKDGDLYRMYYRGLPEAGKDGSALEVTCYAESGDGTNWTKPDVELFEVQGTRKNNVVLANQPPFSHNFAPFKDTRTGVPEAEQYKALAGTSATGLHAFVSTEGLFWRNLGQVISRGAFDSQNVAFWSEHEQQYACYFRTWTEGEFSGYRTISRCTSPDFIHWSDPVEMGFGGAPLEHLYTNQTGPYFRAPHIYIGLAARFMPGRNVVGPGDAGAIGVEQAYSADCSDGVLLTSRGGNQYSRMFMEGFITPGIGPEHWTSRSNYAANGVVPLDDETMAIFVQQRYGQPAACLRQFTLRTDGFACITAPYSGGSVLTKPLRFRGNTLKLNAATSAAGGIRVELRGADGTPVPGFNLDECKEIVGNGLSLACEWESGASLAEIGTGAVQLYIWLRDARVFSFRFE